MRVGDLGRGRAVRLDQPAARRFDWDAGVMALQAVVCAGIVACFWWVLL
ncbi:hypothetical protein ACIGFJ_17140 [Brevundimonas diminuta]